jgi:predicted aspartyl protease
MLQSATLNDQELIVALTFHFRAILFLAVVHVSLLEARSLSAQEAPSNSQEVRLFSAPDESGQPLQSVKEGEVLSPVAETKGAGGVKWYLVRTESGAVGWLKGDEGEQSKKLEDFFRGLPAETSAGRSISLPEPPPGSLPRGAIAVPVEALGASVIVPVMLNRSLKAYLVLDTGATGTVVSRRIASNLGLPKIGSTKTITVGGSVTRPIARLRSLKVGEAEVQNLVVLIHDFHPHPRIEGLLGMDFLGRFHVSLDSRKQLLVLSPR